MPPQTKSKNTRVYGLQKNYKYKGWLDSVLNSPKPSLDYFKFADTFKSNQSVTNCHYKDLLQTLSNGQSNKLTKIVSIAKSLFDVRNDVKSGFGEKYATYWEQRDESDMQRTLRIQNQRTIKRLNQITNNEIAHNLDTVPNETAGKSGEVNESEEENWTESGAESDAESGTEVALRQTANLASDEVGRLQIIDLSSTTALDILKLEIPIDQFNAIIEAANMDPVPMSAYASELSNALNKAPLSTRALRETLYDVGYRKDFDLVAHDDANFMEITIRYL
ncbi:hypothetical protein DFQ28_009557 [Apophysomyces sp. BC1034]|nr:hypothetical protein DFQ29_008272 [Apophysomyces sp. BC1021]KAG0185316.1 hypothetical protein DFQ28_009557 [Apophysomyces sp. BC1034]